MSILSLVITALGDRHNVQGVNVLQVNYIEIHAIGEKISVDKWENKLLQFVLLTLSQVA